MNRILLVLAICIGMAAVAGLFGWAILSVQDFTARTGASTVVAVSILGGGILTALLTGFFIWLAFYSSRKGYDEPPRVRRVGKGPRTE